MLGLHHVVTSVIASTRLGRTESEISPTQGQVSYERKLLGIIEVWFLKFAVNSEYSRLIKYVFDVDGRCEMMF